MMGLIAKLSSAMGAGSPQRSSKDEAKQRLKVVLIHDQINLTPTQMQAMKDEILGVISRYCEIVDDDDVRFQLDRLDQSVVLHTSVPVRGMPHRLR
ncbi:MAG: cell division topological specificity factor MinE [Myxococcota bacterium]